MSNVFAGILGHQAQKEQLLALKAGNAVPHALLFSGPSGIGKRTLAQAFSAALLTRDGDIQAQAKLLQRGNHPDFHPVYRDPEKKDLSVDRIRNVCTKLQLKPYSSAASVALIDNAEEMTIAASNALLMTLEEPPAHGFIILISKSPHRLPDTIISRCQAMHFASLPANDLEAVLKKILPSSPEIHKELLKFTEGSLAALGLEKCINPVTRLPHDEAQLLEQCKFFLKESARLSRMIERAFAGSGGESGITSVASDLAAEKESLPLVWQLIRQQARSALRNSATKMPQLNVSAQAELILDAIDSAERSSERSLNPQLQISSILLKAGEALRA